MRLNFFFAFVISSIHLASCSSSVPGSSVRKSSPTEGPAAGSAEASSKPNQENKEGSANPAPAKAADPAPFDVTKLVPNGSWVSACIEDFWGARGTSYQTRVEYTDDTITSTQTHFDRTTCATNGEATHFYLIKSTFKLGAESTIIKGARDIETTQGDVFLTGLTAAFIQKANLEILNGSTDWQSGVPKLFMAATNEIRPDVFQIIGSQLCFGKYEYELVGNSKMRTLVGIDEKSCLNPAKK